MKITKKQKLFIEEYLIDLNATQAAIRAGYSEKSARVHASKLLTNANIQECLSEKMNERSKNAEVNAEKVLNELSSIAFADLTEKGLIRPSDKIRALELLGKHLAMFTERSITSIKNDDDVGITKEQALRMAEEYILSFNSKNLAKSPEKAVVTENIVEKETAILIPEKQIEQRAAEPEAPQEKPENNLNRTRTGNGARIVTKNENYFDEPMESKNWKDHW